MRRISPENYRLRTEIVATVYLALFNLHGIFSGPSRKSEGRSMLDVPD